MKPRLKEVLPDANELLSAFKSLHNTILTSRANALTHRTRVGWHEIKMHALYDVMADIELMRRRQGWGGGGGG